MEKQIQFIKEEIKHILEKMKKVREERDNRGFAHQEYKTLTNSLSDIISLIWQINANENFYFYKDFHQIENKLIVEADKLKDIINLALFKENYKYHHTWLYSYRELLNSIQKIKNEIKYQEKREVVQKTLPQYK